MLSRPLLEDFASWLRKAENGLRGNALSAGITKTKVGRTIPLSPHLLDELAA